MQTVCTTHFNRDRIHHLHQSWGGIVRGVILHRSRLVCQWILEREAKEERPQKRPDILHMLYVVFWAQKRIQRFTSDHVRTGRYIESAHACKLCAQHTLTGIVFIAFNINHGESGKRFCNADG